MSFKDGNQEYSQDELKLRSGEFELLRRLFISEVEPERKGILEHIIKSGINQIKDKTRREQQKNYYYTKLGFHTLVPGVAGADGANPDTVGAEANAGENDGAGDTVRRTTMEPDNPDAVGTGDTLVHGADTTVLAAAGGKRHKTRRSKRTRKTKKRKQKKTKQSRRRRRSKK